MSNSDPVKIDPKDYSVEFENEQVRVIRAKLGPHAVAPMHEHPLNRVTVASRVAASTPILSASSLTLSALTTTPALNHRPGIGARGCRPCYVACAARALHAAGLPHVPA